MFNSISNLLFTQIVALGSVIYTSISDTSPILSSIEIIEKNNTIYVSTQIDQLEFPELREIINTGHSVDIEFNTSITRINPNIGLPIQLNQHQYNSSIKYNLLKRNYLISTQDQITVHSDFNEALLKWKIMNYTPILNIQEIAPGYSYTIHIYASLKFNENSEISQLIQTKFIFSQLLPMYISKNFDISILKK